MLASFTTSGFCIFSRPAPSKSFQTDTVKKDSQLDSGAKQAPSDLPSTAEFEAESLPHMNDLYRAAVRMLQDPGKAGDAVQETYLIAWKSFGKYRQGTNCRAWLFQILFNVVRHERRTWFKWITGKEEDLAEAQLAAPDPMPESLTDGEILAALDKLPAQFREALLLVDVEEFSYREASEILQIPIGTIMSRLNRARALLRDRLTDVARSYGLSGAPRGPRYRREEY
jgi:RNA polymerase sigma-70 factor (ECF subfamily)